MFVNLKAIFDFNFLNRCKLNFRTFFVMLEIIYLNTTFRYVFLNKSWDISFMQSAISWLKRKNIYTTKFWNVNHVSPIQLFLWLALLILWSIKISETLTFIFVARRIAICWVMHCTMNQTKQWPFERTATTNYQNL